MPHKISSFLLLVLSSTRWARNVFSAQEGDSCECLLVVWYYVLSFKINALAALNNLSKKCYRCTGGVSAAHEHVAVPFYVTPYLPSPVFLRLPDFWRG